MVSAFLVWVERRHGAEMSPENFKLDLGSFSFFLKIFGQFLIYRLL
jgi:hypothetical protein